MEGIFRRRNNGNNEYGDNLQATILVPQNTVFIKYTGKRQE